MNCTKTYGKWSQAVCLPAFCKNFGPNWQTRMMQFLYHFWFRDNYTSSWDTIMIWPSSLNSSLLLCCLCYKQNFSPVIDRFLFMNEKTPKLFLCASSEPLLLHQSEYSRGFYGHPHWVSTDTVQWSKIGPKSFWRTNTYPNLLVASISPSCFEVHAGLFILSIKGIFDEHLVKSRKNFVRFFGRYED